MSAFKEYLRKCVTNNSDIMIKSKHLDSVTFEDICMVIHHVEKNKRKIKLRDDAIIRKMHNNVRFNLRATIENGEKDEKLAILVFIAGLSGGYTHAIATIRPIDDSGVYPKYEMSRDFVLAAKKCGTIEHDITKCVIVAFNIKYDQSFEEADQYMNHYLGFSTKSSRSG